MFVVCRYGEIALKGKNRKFFEQKLLQNIKSQLSPKIFKSAKRTSGRILLEIAENAPVEEIINQLGRIFGIVNFSLAEKCPSQIKSIKNAAIKFVAKQNFKTFKVVTSRSQKTFPLTSPQVNEILGEAILKKFKNKKVRLKDPEFTLFVEIGPKETFLSGNKIKGLGGLPVGVSGKGLCLLSGGIDSPVAAFLSMKRGLETHLLHFHSLPYTKKEEIEKTKKIASILAKYQPKTKLFLVPFADIQKEILLKTQPKLRVVLYRRMMFRIAEKLAKTQKIKAIITGENLAQVASQTTENLFAIQKAVDFLVLRPLLGYDKKEIIDLAKKIATYEISILPYEDCCSRFLPKHPETKSRLKEIEKEEKKLNIHDLVQSALSQKKTLSFSANR